MLVDRIISAVSQVIKGIMPISKKEIKQYQDNWYKENAPFGKELGYPDCCIREFCVQPPELLKLTPVSESDRRRCKAAFINGVYTGFIPCEFHANEILSGRVTLESLIKNRNPDFPPFPDY